MTIEGWCVVLLFWAAIGLAREVCVWFGNVRRRRAAREAWREHAAASVAAFKSQRPWWRR